MRFGSLRRAAIALVVALTGCEPDTSATLEAAVENPVLAVEPSALVAELSGAFDLVLSLGQYSPEATSVTPGAFSIQRGGVEIVGGSGFEPIDAGVPVTIGPGETRRIAYSIEREVELDVAETLCEGSVAILGSIQDSLSERPRSLSSGAFAATCDSIR